MKKYIPWVLLLALSAALAVSVVTRPRNPNDISRYHNLPEVSHEEAAALVDRINAACATYHYGGKVYHGHMDDFTPGDEYNPLPKSTVKVSCSQDHAEDNWDFKTWVVAVAR